MKIVVLDGYLVGFGGIDWSGLSELGELIYYDMASDSGDIAACIGDADVVCTNRCPVTAETISACPGLRLIHSFGTGYSQIDMAAAERAGIVVCNTPAYGRGAVAQMAAALLFAAVRNVSAFDRYVKTVGWKESIDPQICSIEQMELTGKTIGIVGMGDIGYALAKIAAAMDMRVLAYRRRPDSALENDLIRFVDLDSLLRQSDIVSLHCPLTEQTRGLIGRGSIEKMRPGAVLINTSRGAVVDERAVLAALESGKLRTYATDVFCDEPCGGDNPLALHPHCIATPHVAWSPRETRQKIVDIAVDNIRAFAAGTPKNLVSAV
ncbi:NAD(P)-dependent oxidoreductase [Oscillospiraceae bacterium 44-34]